MSLGTREPPKFKLLNGQTLQEADYPNFFAELGLAGTGSLVLPDMADRYPVGQSGSKTVATTVGSNTRTITEAQMPTHNHSISHVHDLSYSTGTGAGGKVARGTATEVISTANAVYDSNPSTSGNAGSGDAINIEPAGLAVNFLVRVAL